MNKSTVISRQSVVNMNKYKATIGLEIHAELRTKTKMFCRSKNDPDEKRPNVNICPVCMGHPGTLPVINKEAVRHVLRVGSAIGGILADFSEFDRKNYFYPDIPKGYQISQYKYPLVSGGQLNGVKITRVHLEEDTARSVHDNASAGKSVSGRTDEEGNLSETDLSGYSLVDFNRAGVPLMELVTEPVIHDAKTAGDFARELRLLLRCLGASEANMEKGEMRVEANVSVSTEYRVPSTELGTKVEVKNLNSFRSVEKAIEYEIARQINLLESDGKVVQETRGWDENKGSTFTQREKEFSHDYRYFPDPDLPKLKLSEIEDFRDIERTLLELPWVKRERLVKEFGLKAESAALFVQEEDVGMFFEEAVGFLADRSGSAELAANYITSDLAGLAKGSYADMPIIPAEFAELINMVAGNELSSRGAKDVLAVMWSEGGSPKIIAEAKGLIQKNDMGELERVAKEIIVANEKVVAEYKSGKTGHLQFLIGQGMKATKGAGNPKLLGELFRKLLQ